MRVVALVLFILGAAPAEAQVTMAIDQRLVGIVNPEGIEHAVTVGARARLGDPSELLFTGAHVEAGVVSYLAPIDAMVGGYLQLSPFAFLVLRAEVMSLSMWSLDMPGAGYHPVDGYGAQISSENLPASAGGTADGWNLQLSAILQGAVPIGDARLILWNQLVMTHQSLGQADHYYTPRYDLILARQDWILGNHGMLLLEVPLDTGLRLRFGGYDHLAYVPRSGALINQAGAAALLVIENPTEGVTEVMPFARVGGFTNHERRAGTVTFLLGISARYDVAP